MADTTTKAFGSNPKKMVCFSSNNLSKRLTCPLLSHLPWYGQEYPDLCLKNLNHKFIPKITSRNNCKQTQGPTCRIRMVPQRKSLCTTDTRRRVNEHEVIGVMLTATPWLAIGILHRITAAPGILCWGLTGQNPLEGV